MVTLFTPTYNRADLLNRLYASVLRQSDNNFEWIIIDDGSSDGTKEKIEGWIKENKANIRYIYQTNAGKAAAFNKCADYAKGEVVCCVDSDDYLTNDAVEVINKSLPKIRRSDVAGMVALKTDFEGKYLGKRFPQDVEYETVYNLDAKYQCRGEWSHIYKTEILKKYKYPIIEGEKFITESVLFDAIAKEYKVLLINQSVNFCEYQAGGLSNSIYECMKENPTGFKIFYMQRIDMALSFKERVMYAVRYIAFKKLSKDSRYDYRGKHKCLMNLLSPVCYVAKKYYMKKLER